MLIPVEFVAAALTAMTTVIGILWRIHLQADTEDRRQRDVAMEGWKGQTIATERLTRAVDRLSLAIKVRTKDDVGRRRLSDGRDE